MASIWPTTRLNISPSSVPARKGLALARLSRWHGNRGWDDFLHLPSLGVGFVRRLKSMSKESYIHLVVREFKRLKGLADGAMAQVTDDHFFALPAAGDNSIAVIVKHVGGNLLSRWTNFLTSDGEKPGRDRDTEFFGSRLGYAGESDQPVGARLGYTFCVAGPVERRGCRAHREDPGRTPECFCKRSTAN